MEQAHLRVLVQALEEVLEWVDHDGEERVAPERVQAQQGSVFVPNAELSQPHEVGIPCSLKQCPKCGAKMVRK